MTDRRSSPLFLALLLAGLWLRLLTPQGWMPADGPLLALCGSGGWAVAGATGGEAPTDPDPLCGFAALSDALLGAAALALPALLLAFARPAMPVPVRLCLRRRAPCPPGRGPPAA